MAETTTTTGRPEEAVRATRRAAARMRSAVANDEPPYFWTINRALADNVGSAIGKVQAHRFASDGQLRGGVGQCSGNPRGHGVIGAQTEDRRASARRKRA